MSEVARAAVVVAVGWLAACYSPDPAAARCSVRCGPGGLCPGGFSCLEDNFCHPGDDPELCGPCTALRCADLDRPCGEIDDGCGGVLDCGGCEAPLECGAREPNVCDAPDECTPECVEGELACGDDSCGGSCGSCPDERWDCHDTGVCCIRANESCQPLLEGCNCCPGLFCINGICQPGAGCSAAPDLGP